MGLIDINFYNYDKFMAEYSICGYHLKISEYARFIGFNSTTVNTFGSWMIDKKDYTMFILKYGE